MVSTSIDTITVFQNKVLEITTIKQEIKVFAEKHGIILQNYINTETVCYAYSVKKSGVK